MKNKLKSIAKYTLIIFLGIPVLVGIVGSMFDSEEDFNKKTAELEMVIAEKKAKKEAEEKARFEALPKKEQEKILAEKKKAEVEKKEAERIAKIEKQKALDAKNWAIYEEKDEFTDKITKRRLSVSTKAIHFDFPYNGGTYFTLLIREKSGKTEVLLSCDKCQFIGQGIYDTETLKVRFDDKKTTNYGYSGSSDYSSDVVFLSNPQKFINELKKSRTLKIGAPFYKEGIRTIEFNVAGYEQ